jgi:YbbR domain-containing protein
MIPLKLHNFYEILHRNWPAKVLSLLAALLIVFFYRVITDEERSLNIPLQIITDADFFPSGNYPKNVRVTVKGNSNQIFQLDESMISVYADFSEHRTEGLFRAPIELERSVFSEFQMDISVQPIEVDINLERKAVKTVEVIPKTNSSPTIGFESGAYFLNPRYVTIEGPRSLVSNLTTISTRSIDLTGKDESFSVLVALEKPYPSLVIREGDQVEFSLQIQESVLVKTFEDISVASIFLNPSLKLDRVIPDGTVKLQGNFSRLESLDEKDLLMYIDCSSITEAGTYSLPVELNLPDGITVLDLQPVTVEISVSNVEGIQ